MIGFIRKFSNSLLAKVFLSIVAGSFILFWGINDVIRRLTNSDYIIKVGDSVVAPEEFQEQYQKNLNMFQSLAQRMERKNLQSILMQYTISSMINKKLLDIMFAHFNLTLSSKVIKYALSHDPRFLGSDGKFNKIKFDEFLKSNKFTEEMFLDNVPNDIQIMSMKLPLDAAYNPPKELARLMKNAEEERRFVKVYEVRFDSIKNFPMPDSKVLMSFYEKNKDELFVVPEYRTVDLIEFDEKNITSVVQESEIKALHEKRLQEEGVDDPYDVVHDSLKAEIEQEKNYTVLSNVTKILEKKINSKESFRDVLKEHKFLKHKKIKLNKNNFNEFGKKILDEAFADHVIIVSFDSNPEDEAVFVEAGNGMWFLVKIVDVEESKIKSYAEMDKSVIYNEWNKMKKITTAEETTNDLVKNINAGRSVSKSFKELLPLIRRDIAALPNELDKKLFMDIFELEVGKASFSKKSDAFVIAVLAKKEYPKFSDDEIDEYSRALKSIIIDDMFVSLMDYFKSTNQVKVNSRMLNNNKNDIESEDDAEDSVDTAIDQND